MDTRIAHTGQHLVNELDAERFAAALGEAMSVQIRSDVLDPERAGLPVAEQIELEDEPDDLRFLGLRFELLLFFVAMLLNGHRAIAEGRSSPIPIAPAGIFQHGADDVLGRLLTRVF